MERNQTRLHLQILWIFTTNQQTHNDMSHIRQTTHPIV